MRTTTSGQSSLLLLDVIDILNKRQIPYAIIGAFAVSFYGVVRASLDADAVISVDHSQDLIDLCSELNVIGLKIEHRKGDHDDPIAAVINIQDQYHNRVDLLIGIQGITKEVFHRTREANFMGALIKVISQEDLIALKIFAGSPKDMGDVIGVLEISGQKINLPLLKQLVSSYGSDCAQRLQRILNDHPLK